MYAVKKDSKIIQIENVDYKYLLYKFEEMFI